MTEREFCYKFPTDGLKIGTQLVVYPTQIAFFVKGGAICDEFTKGTYTIESVGIAIYDDRIEVESYGTLPETIKMEDLLVAHRSAPRNKLIADTLYKTDLLESWGRGIDLMRNECRRVNQPEPEFVNEYSFFVVYFRYNRPLTTIVTTGVSDQVKRLVNILGDTQLSLKAITDALNLKSSANVRRKYINPALEGTFRVPLFSAPLPTKGWTTASTSRTSTTRA